MLHPNQFQVNEVWVAVKANRKPIEVREGLFNILTVMDAASTFIIGHTTVPAEDESPPKEAVVSIFQKGWDQKQAWPKRIIIPNSHTKLNTFKIVADERGIAVENVPMQELLAIVQPMQQSFAESFQLG
jgi:hypothetical protein